MENKEEMKNIIINSETVLNKAGSNVRNVYERLLQKGAQFETPGIGVSVHSNATDEDFHKGIVLAHSKPEITESSENYDTCVMTRGNDEHGIPVFEIERARKKLVEFRVMRKRPRYGITTPQDEAINGKFEKEVIAYFNMKLDNLVLTNDSTEEIEGIGMIGLQDNVVLNEDDKIIEAMFNLEGKMSSRFCQNAVWMMSPDLWARLKIFQTNQNTHPLAIGDTFDKRPVLTHAGLATTKGKVFLVDLDRGLEVIMTEPKICEKADPQGSRYVFEYVTLYCGVRVREKDAFMAFDISEESSSAGSKK